MAATSMARAPARAAANMDATTTAHASPTRLGANTAPIQITAIACVRIPAPMVATTKVNHAAARSPAQTAVMRPALNVSVKRVVPKDLHATIKQADAPASAHAPMDAKTMAHAMMHAKPYNALARMNNAKTAIV